MADEHNIDSGNGGEPSFELDMTAGFTEDANTSGQENSGQPGATPTNEETNTGSSETLGNDASKGTQGGETKVGEAVPHGTKVNSAPTLAKSEAGKDGEKGKSPLDPTAQQAQQKLSRDYSKYPEETFALRKLGNAEYATITSKLDELKSLKSEHSQLTEKLKILEAGAEEAKKSSSIYDHPEGYKLLPEYSKLVEDYSYADREASFIQEQLILCQAGKPWKQLVSFDAQGNFITKDISAAAPNTVTNLRNAQYLQQWVNRVEGVKSGLNNQAGQLQASYAGNYKNATGQLNTNLTNYVARLPEDVRPSEEAINKILASAPASLRNLPTARVTATALALCDNALDKVRKLEETINSRAKVQLDEKLSGPKIKAVGGSHKSQESSDDVIDFAEIDKVFGSPTMA